MAIDELEPIRKSYVVSVTRSPEGKIIRRGQTYRADYLRCPINWDEKLIEAMVNGCLSRWDIALRTPDKKPTKIIATVFQGFREIFYEEQ